MSVYTYVNLDADANLSNPDNWYVAGSPAGQVPTSSDTAILDGLPVNAGSLDAPVTSASGTTINGGTFNGDFSASGVTFNGGTFNGAVAFGTGSTLGADPGKSYTATGTTFGSGTYSTSFTDLGGNTYSGGLFNVAFQLGAGSNISSGTFNYALTTVTSGSSPSISGGSFASGCVFTSTTISGGTFPDGTVFSKCQISGGTLGTSVTGVTVSGAGSTISGGSFTQLTVNGDVTFSGSPTFSLSLTIHNVRGPYTFSADIPNVTINIPDPAYPSVTEVNATTTYGDIGDGQGPLHSGTLVLPVATDVRSGTVYGVGGTGSTGSLVAGGGTRAYAG